MFKRLLLLFAFVPTLVWAQSTTPNIGLQIPATGSNNWYIPLNYDFSRLDLYLSGNAAIPGLAVNGNVTISGSITAGQIIGTGGSIFATAASASQYSPVYYSQSPNGTAFAGVAPFTGFAYYRGNGPPRVASQADLNTLIGGAACGTAGTAYSPQAGNCITVGSGAVASSAQYSIPFFSAAGTSNALAGATGLSTNAAGDSITATNTVTGNIVIGTSILGGGALSIQGTSFTSGAFGSTNSSGTGIALTSNVSSVVDTWQMNALANNHLQFINTSIGSAAALDITAAGLVTISGLLSAQQGVSTTNVAASGTVGAGSFTGASATLTGALTAGTLMSSGNIIAAGTVNSTANTSPASITNTGVALVGNPGGVADLVYYDSTRTANNRTLDALWSSGVYSLRFKNDAQSSATPFFTAIGGFAGGITGITSNSGSGSWTQNSTNNLNTIFTSSNAGGTQVSLTGTATGVNNWLITSGPSGNLSFANQATTFGGGFDSTGRFSAANFNTTGSVSASQIVTAGGEIAAQGGNIRLATNSGVYAMCLGTSGSCIGAEPGTYNGIAVDMTSFPNRLELHSMNLFTFFSNGNDVFDIDGTGNLTIVQPLKFNGPDLATAVTTGPTIPTFSFPVSIRGATYYLLLTAVQP
jgi:hypothetical protein